MKTHKVDVVSGYSYPQDTHALWFDESQDVLKKYDGTKWVSGNAASNDDRNYERNFYTKEEVVPSQVIWQGNAHSGDRIENFIQEPVAYEQYTFELSDGRTFDASWGDVDDFQIYDNNGKPSETISIGYRLFGSDDYGWVFIHEGNDANLVKISTAETTQDVLVWNYQDSLPIAMPKCIEDRGLFAEFNELPEAGKAYYFPYNNEDLSLMPVLITDISCEQGKGGLPIISGTCIGIGFSIAREINTRDPEVRCLNISSIDGETFFGYIVSNENVSHIDPNDEEGAS